MAEKAKVKKVKWLRSHPNFVAVKGDEGEVREDIIQKFNLDGKVYDDEGKVVKGKSEEYVSILS